jgi:N-acetylglucosaminyl-diphospho-decaprenol L-rhamnosyltransferase
LRKGKESLIGLTHHNPFRRQVPKIFADIPVAVSVIIVSFNTRELTRGCLKAVFSGIGSLVVEVLVVDNASTDGSIEMIRLEFPLVHIIENGRNLGFGVANNQAMKIARGKFLLLLNSDALLGAGALNSMVSAMNAHPGAAVMAPQLANGDGSLQRSCWRFPSPWRVFAEALWISNLFPDHSLLGDFRNWKHDVEQKVEWAIGACLMVRYEVYKLIGGFDERFFMYAEETDWERRMVRAGWEIWLTPEAHVIHLGGASGNNASGVISEHFFHSHDLYWLKHHGRAGLIFARIATVIGCSIRALIWFLAEPVARSNRETIRAKRLLRSALARRAAFSWKILSVGESSPRPEAADEAGAPSR